MLTGRKANLIILRKEKKVNPKYKFKVLGGDIKITESKLTFYNPKKFTFRRARGHMGMNT